MTARIVPVPAAIVVFLLCLAGAVFPPFIPLSGPLSVDDLLPLAGMLVLLAAVPFWRAPLPVDATLLGFLLLGVCSVVSSASNAETIGEFARLFGRSTGRVIFYQSLIVGARMLLGERDWARRALVFVVTAGTIEALFGVWAYQAQYVGPYGIGVVSFADWSVLAGRTRIQGTFSGLPGRYDFSNVGCNFLAAYLVMTIPLTLGLFTTARRWLGRTVLFMATGFQVVALYLTYTRAALVALAVGVLAFGFLIGRKRLAIGLVVIGIVATLVIPSVRSKVFGESHDRWALFWASAKISSDHPIVGVGDGNYERILHQNQEYFDTPFGSATTTSHNSVLLSAATHGLAGGVAHAFLYLTVLLVAARSLRRAENIEARYLTAAVIAACVGFLTQDQLNNLAYVPKVATQFWLLVALLPLVARTLPRASVLGVPHEIGEARDLTVRGPEHSTARP